MVPRRNKWAYAQKPEHFPMPLPAEPENEQEIMAQKPVE